MRVRWSSWQPAGDELVIKNTFFFPISTWKRPGNACALSRPSPLPVCVRPSSQAWQTNAEPYEYREQKIAAGFTRPADVPADDRR